MMITPHLDEMLQRLEDDRLQMAGLTRHFSMSPQAIPAVFLFSESLHYNPSVEEMLDTYLRNYTGRGLPKSHHTHVVNLDLVISPNDLAGRTHLPVHVPLFHICDRCGGSGHAGFFGCDKCDGAGIIEEFRTIDVIIPPIGPEGASIPVSLKHLGVENLQLNLRIIPQA